MNGVGAKRHGFPGRLAGRHAAKCPQQQKKSQCSGNRLNLISGAREAIAEAATKAQGPFARFQGDWRHAHILAVPVG
jgi:hypothetical protein